MIGFTILGMVTWLIAVITATIIALLAHTGDETRKTKQNTAILALTMLAGFVYTCPRIGGSL